MSLFLYIYLFIKIFATPRKESVNNYTESVELNNDKFNIKKIDYICLNSPDKIRLYYQNKSNFFCRDEANTNNNKINSPPQYIDTLIKIIINFNDNNNKNIYKKY